MMNKDLFERKWEMVRGAVRGWWSKFTEDDLDKVAGQFEVFISILRDKYGYSRARAVKEIAQHIAEYDAQRKKYIHTLQFIGIPSVPFANEQGHRSTTKHGIPWIGNIQEEKKK
jgi:uncharacterized protein YjbJ (UPF0337 family)